VPENLQQIQRYLTWLPPPQFPAMSPLSNQWANSLTHRPFLALNALRVQYRYFHAISGKLAIDKNLRQINSRVIPHSKCLPGPQPGICLTNFRITDEHLTPIRCACTHHNIPRVKRLP
jgi:hypothetical protein